MVIMVRLNSRRISVNSPIQLDTHAPPDEREEDFLERLVGMLRHELFFAFEGYRAPVVYDADAFAQRLDLFQIMRRHEDGHAIRIDLAQKVPKFEAQFDVHARRR